MKKLFLLFVFLITLIAFSSCEKHNMEYVESLAPTCTETGHNSYYKCTDEGCEYTEGYEIIAAKGHTLSYVKGKPNTCTEDGYTEYYKCSAEGCLHKEGYSLLPAKGHDFIKRPAKEATVNEKGHTAYTECVLCGLREGYKETEKSHTMAYRAAKKPTCTSAGYDAYYYCTDSGCKYVEGFKPIASLGHKYENIPAKEPTRTADGYTEHKRCTVCHKKTAFDTLKYIYSVEGFLPDLEDRLLLRNLSKEDMAIVKAMYDTVMCFEKKYTFEKSLTVDEGCLYTYYLLSSCPELMQINQEFIYHYNGNKIISIEFKYVLEKQKYYSAMDTVKTMTLDILGGLEGKSDFEKEKYVYDFIIETCSYDNESANYTNSYGALIDKKVNCQGFSRTFSLFMQAAGIPCAGINGTTSSGNGHAWNIIELDGKCYYVDPTWDNIDKEGYSLMYGYFNVDLNSMKNAGHKVDKVWENHLPECNSMELSIPYLNGTYIKSYENVLSRLDEIIQYCVGNRIMEIYIRTETAEQFVSLKEKAVDMMSGYLNEHEYSYRYKYNYDEDVNTFIILFEKLEG